MLEARIVKKTGFGVRDSRYFEAISISPITENEAAEAQENLGYSPAGYDFFNFEISYDPILMRHKATWQCQASCD